MDLIKNWKLHLLALLIVIVAESIGMKRQVGLGYRSEPGAVG